MHSLLTHQSSYEDAIWSATLDYSDHATLRITEIEVFTGIIFNKTGVQTRRQRDKSVQLKDDFDRIVQWAEAMISKRKMKTSDERNEEEQTTVDSDDALILSMACLAVGCKKQPSNRSGSGRSGENFQSFKVIAACCAIRHLDAVLSRRQSVAAGC